MLGANLNTNSPKVGQNFQTKLTPKIASVPSTSFSPSLVTFGGQSSTKRVRMLLSFSMTHHFIRHALVVSTMLLYATSASADAIMRSQAMFADTIAEY
jgi:hypothetical protein